MPPSTVSVRRPRGCVPSRRRALPTVVSSSACASPRKPSASSSAVAAAGQDRPAWKPPATISTSLRNNGEGGRPGEGAERDAHHASERRVGSCDARDGALGRARLVLERAVSQRRNRPLSRRHGRRCGRRHRRARAACRSRCRARSRPCARGSSTRATASRAANARGTGSPRRARRARRRSGRPVQPAPRSRARARARSARRRAAPPAGGPRTASAETGGGASECASGSQLCTGAQPIFAARPASRRT